MAGEQLVTKMEVKAYKDIKFSGVSLGEFELQVNPTEIAVSFRHRMKIIVNSNIQ